jgi:hypothetical protein
MDLFEILAQITKPKIVEIDDTPKCCNKKMTHIETMGHWKGRNYSTYDEGIWVEDYEIWHCEKCGKETKIFI